MAIIVVIKRAIHALNVIHVVIDAGKESIITVVIVKLVIVSTTIVVVCVTIVFRCISAR
ncbi:MAG: hypothetical protein Dasosvirus23_4 [Dasosvirus sp.]|uniref:Uncharacterized protein n=1 Tax=Dasosvirus sp. TaxID=2487764 RepID=A0A3G4ZS15_9VIRU|nr:MAG: hypothetical protein Dasosvirus23_4 [Dasosvirus sp.]